MSDVNFKTNINSISNAINTVNQLDGKSFEWLDTGIGSYGVIAQEIADVIPDIVKENEQGIKGVNYDSLIAYLIEAIRELKTEIEELKRK